MKHTWSYQEDLICCREYLDRCIVNVRFQELDDFLNELSIKLPNIEKGSIRVKLQNIKKIMDEYDLIDVFDISPLKHYSNQCKRAFLQTIREITGRF